MVLYAGFDLHSNNCHLGIVDQAGKRVMGRKLRNEPGLILAQLEPYKGDLAAVTVESTFNWYWLVDLLMEHNYSTHLANPSAIQRYSGLKFSDDAHDAFWLADMLRLGILPRGYIYPKESRPVRDLLRKRGHLVRLRTSLILSLKSMVARNSGVLLNVNDIKACKQDRVSPLLPDEEHLQLGCRASKETIDFLTRQIRGLETAVEKSTREMEGYELLQTMPGVGKILSLTIFLETGDVGRFAGPGNYASYCRKVPTSWTSNGKRKGAGNRKNGNKHLAWAFSEAAEKARVLDARARAFYNRKLSRTNRMVAHSALAHKLARAAFHILRGQVRFDGGKAFG